MSGPQFYDTCKEGIVCISCNGDLKGGGVFVEVGERKLVLTAAHVVHERQPLTVRCCDGTSFDVIIDHINREADLAWLQVVGGDTSGLPCLKLSHKEIRNGSYVHFIGHPSMARYSYNIGKVVSSSRKCHSIYFDELLLVRAPEFGTVIPGLKLIDDFFGLDSEIQFVKAKNIHGGGRFGGTGAPFLDCDGNIMGIYSFTFRESDYAISAPVIKKWEDEVEATSAEDDEYREFM